jgi:hypothetical protein
MPAKQSGLDLIARVHSAIPVDHLPAKRQRVIPGEL